MKSILSFRLAISGFIFILIASVKLFAVGGDLNTTFGAGATNFGSYVQTVAVQNGRARADRGQFFDRQRAFVQGTSRLDPYDL